MCLGCWKAACRLEHTNGAKCRCCAHAHTPSRHGPQFRPAPGPAACKNGTETRQGEQLPCSFRPLVLALSACAP